MRFPQRPIVSVIIPSYNHAPFVRKAITSVLKQNVAALEIIVVDDASSDSTPEKVKQIKDPRIKLIQLKTNRAFHPRNTALNLAKGKYIAFQNSDDEWTKGKLAAQLDILERKKNIVACFTEVEIIGKFGFKEKDTWANGLFCAENKNRHEWLRRFFDVGNCLCITSAVVRHEALKKVGLFRPSLVQISDLDLWIRLLAIGDFHIINKPFTKMRVVKNKNLSEPSAEGMRRYILEYASVLEHFTKDPLLKDLAKIFPDSIPASENKINRKLALLAIHAWQVGGPSHYLLADRIVANLFDKEFSDADLFQKYIKKRSKVSVTIQNKI